MASLGETSPDLRAQITRRSGRTAVPGRRAGTVLAVILMALVVLSPLPFGSMPPVFTAISATVVGAAGLVYFLSMARSGATIRLPVRNLALTGVLQLIVCGYLVLQMLPLGQVVPITFFNRAGDAINSATLSLTPGSTWLMLVRMIGYGIFFFLVAQVSVNRQRARRMLEFLFIAVAAYALLGIFMLTQMGDTYFGLPKIRHFGSATGPFLGRTTFATFLALGLVIGASLMLDALLSTRSIQDRLMRLAMLAAIAAPILTALLATDSRMGTMAGLCGCFAVLALGSTKLKISVRRWVLVLVALLAVVLVLMFTLGTGLLERIVSPDTSGDVRADLYVQLLEMIRARPLLGYGGGSFELAFPLYHQLPVMTDYIWDHAHSSYLTLWLELGLVVGTVPMVIIGLLGWRALRTYAASRSNWVIGLAGVGAFVVGAVHSTVDFSLEIQGVTYLFTALLAMAAPGAASAEDGEREAAGPTRTSRRRSR